jgi:hypothetical protein
VPPRNIYPNKTVEGTSRASAAGGGGNGGKMRKVLLVELELFEKSLWFLRQESGKDWIEEGGRRGTLGTVLLVGKVMAFGGGRCGASIKVVRGSARQKGAEWKKRSERGERARDRERESERERENPGLSDFLHPPKVP